VHRGTKSLKFLAPVSGEITQVNPDLVAHPQLVVQSPYARGWACLVKPSNLAAELDGLRIGQPVVAWYQDEVSRLRKMLEASGEAAGAWPELESAFFGPGVAVNVPVTETVTAG
jgi:hypothetical protein